ERALLQPLVQEHVSRTIPDQHLHPVPPPVQEHEDVTAHRIGADQAPRRSRQPVEAPAKIHRLRRDVDPHRGRQRQHAPSSTASTRSRSSAAKPGNTRTLHPPSSTISSEAPGPLDSGTPPSATKRAGWNRTSPPPPSRSAQRDTRRGWRPYCRANA